MTLSSVSTVSCKVLAAQKPSFGRRAHLRHPGMRRRRNPDCNAPCNAQSFSCNAHNSGNASDCTWALVYCCADFFYGLSLETPHKECGSRATQTDSFFLRRRKHGEPITHACKLGTATRHVLRSGCQFNQQNGQRCTAPIMPNLDNHPAAQTKGRYAWIFNSLAHAFTSATWSTALWPPWAERVDVWPWACSPKPLDVELNLPQKG